MSFSRSFSWHSHAFSSNPKCLLKSVTCTTGSFSRSPIFSMNSGLSSGSGNSLSYCCIINLIVSDLFLNPNLAFDAANHVGTSLFEDRCHPHSSRRSISSAFLFSRDAAWAFNFLNSLLVCANSFLIFFFVR